ncbi:hypothetical protein MMC34_004423 [Xylographa carneopallida]|nr:hypothetical protein [Xylographa carneopallida]
MASVPPHQAAAQPRRASSYLQDSSTSTSEDFAHLNAEPQSPPTSERSEDSQTVILDIPSSTSTSALPETAAPRSSQGQTLPPEDEPRKCWICFADETEDTPESSVWRSPCPCALVAHESCLLDWVADLEAPTSRKRVGAPTKIQCPQCKKDIIIARPRSYVVEGVNAAERVAGKLVVPGIFATLAGSLFTGCWIHGLTSVYLIFGRDDFKYLMGVDSGEGISAKWGIGLPLVPVVLVLSRTSIADNILPVLPILFFATQLPDGHIGPVDLWPPSAAMTIATLPYVRGAYNEFYKRVFAEREQRWIKAVQPRAGETTDGAPNNGLGRDADADADNDEGNVGFQLDLELQIFEEEVPQPQQPAQNRQEGGEPNAADQGQNQRPAAQAPNLLISTSRIADTVVGALCFPVIASVMGQLIKVGLPKAWTVPSGGRHRPGLLQTRWGRSIIGGCLFVVMKDTLLLYSRYRIAQDHRKRRVVDYDRSKGKAASR